MSTRVGDRNEGDLLVVVKAKQMAAHTFRITGNEKNFPKRYKFTLTDKIVNKSFDIYTLLYEAQEMYPHSKREYEDRLYRIRLAMAYCRSLMSMIEIAKEALDLDMKSVRYWTGLIIEVRKLGIKWIEKTVEQNRGKFK